MSDARNLDQPLWTPSPERLVGSQMTAFREHANARWGLALSDYDSLHAWSVDQPEQFWTSIWHFGEVVGDPGKTVLEHGDRMPGARWFPEATLNFAQNLLRRRDGDEALVFWGEDKVKQRLTWAELYREVAHFAAALREMGIGPGDRVAAYMPNMPQTVVAMLATSSIGAIFTSASPDFGEQGVLDRFGQTEPKVLITVDGYYYNGKAVDCHDKVAAVVAGLPSLKRVVVVPYLKAEPVLTGIAHARSWGEFLKPHQQVTEIEFAQLPFDHPLYIMYSSGTTGVPKCIVHCAGGALLQHIKEHRLHTDVKPGDRVFYFTTCGWMMWNWLVSGLAVGATLLLFDGSPFVDEGDILFDYADAEGMTHFGTSAKFIDHLAKLGRRPNQTHKLDTVRAIMSTGSPLVPEGFDYVYEAIKKDVCLSSISGGTDILSCFVLGNPVLPVWRGEIQCKGLGMAIEVFDDDGKPVRGEKGELVCTKPFPAMPIGFWNDPDNAKYHAAYFERFDNIWCHGDFCEITEHGGLIIHGRSDATLNPGGVRIGTAEIYRQVEKLDEILESLVIGQDWDKDVRVVLFVKLRDGVVLDDALIQKIKQTIRANTTPRHVPAKVVAVDDIPRTRSGKIVELAVRNVVHGRPVKNVEALANPDALDFYRNRKELEQ
ncbi:acetoacetate--CoA ligase [Denitromonas iodatirespirans]|uniref:Acetoacetate--CoA ligase n=1 Tax=Denitromonas iodatirespirans TaxID=2795389 RepID=A0A944D8B4_DENI1|nr:acetoacetate--CoA ligase [Denitromonas iodatirespirans]MBT0960376.1 acetoacetate--CoA ligase [Denitromonas iodatirespirans]